MDKLLQMLGLCKKAGKVKTGEFLCDKAIKSGECALVIIARDASENTKKSITDSCNYYNVKYIEYADMESLGRMTGKEERAVVAVLDEGFAKAILERNGDE